jgi:hypothetical protein
LPHTREGREGANLPDPQQGQTECNLYAEGKDRTSTLQDEKYELKKIEKETNLRYYTAGDG